MKNDAFYHIAHARLRRGGFNPSCAAIARLVGHVAEHHKLGTFVKNMTDDEIYSIIRPPAEVAKKVEEKLP